jgi:pimeloyl-ACP methyl ester carboxylesterase
VGSFLLPVYSYQPTTSELELESADVQAYEESWEDMLRLQREGVYPAAFSAIQSPVLMLHGAADPHPGEMIRASLAPYVPQLEYREWEQCGHYPWIEEHTREEFFSVLRGWLTVHSAK